jgi:hypothetical protein
MLLHGCRRRHWRFDVGASAAALVNVGGPGCGADGVNAGAYEVEPMDAARPAA